MKSVSNVMAIATAMILSGCAAVDDNGDVFFDCVKTLCGCSEAMTLPVTLRMSDADRNPVANARLICHDDSSYLGTTNSDGLLTLKVAGASSPGCGFRPDCQVAYFRTENEQFGRHFWFARFVRGEDVSARAHAVQRVTEPD